jgi:hypothetical protein
MVDKIKQSLLAFTLLLASGAAAHATCIQFVNMGGYWVARNACGTLMSVTWWDQGACRGGCGASIGAYSSQTVYAPQGRYHWRECQGYC